MSESSKEAIDLPASKEELLERIGAEWTLLEGAIAKIKPEDMLKPVFGGWSVKDILVHISTWERFMCLHYMHNRPAHEAFGLDSSEYESLDEDGLNAGIFERNRNRPLTEIRNEFSEFHEQTTRDLDDIAFEVMIDTGNDRCHAGKQMLIGIIANTYEHYREHRESIESLYDTLS